MNWFAFGDTLAQGHRQRVEINEQRDIEKFNIRAAEQNAALTAQQTSAREEQQRRESRQLLGTQRAAIAQSGVGFGGSSADIMRQSAASAELDALNIRYAGDLERMGILNEIEMRKYNDKLLQLQGKQVMRMRWGSALGALFGGGGGRQPEAGKALDAKTGAYGQGGDGGTNHSWNKTAAGAYGGFGGGSTKFTKSSRTNRIGTGPN